MDNREMKTLVKQSKYTFTSNLQMLIMVAPAVILLFIFNYIPMAGIIIAFKDFRANLGFLKSPWIGFKNFEFFFSSQDAWRITRNTIGYNAAFIILGLIISVAFALMLNEIKSEKFLKFYQTVFFFPYFLSWVVVGYALYAFLNMEHGVLNTVLRWFGLEGKSWYTNYQYWPGILISVNLWKTIGYFSVIYYAGLMGIDKQLFEAARIDGANKLQIIMKISIPMIYPLIILLVILQIGRIFYADFGLFYYLPRNIGLLYGATDVIDTYVFRALRVTGNIGMASAANFYQSIMGFCLVLVSNLVVKKINSDYALF